MRHGYGTATRTSPLSTCSSYPYPQRLRLHHGRNWPNSAALEKAGFQFAGPMPASTAFLCRRKCECSTSQALTPIATRLLGASWMNLSPREKIKIDRPKGSTHPRYPTFTYPLDYGYLEGTTSGDRGGIDVWIGSLPGKNVTGVIYTLDTLKRDTEIKLLLGCTPHEARQVLSIHNSGDQAALLIERAEEDGDPQWLRWARDLQAMAQTGLTTPPTPSRSKRYERSRHRGADGVSYSQMEPHTSTSYTRAKLGTPPPKLT